jgi:hypothetical protein
VRSRSPTLSGVKVAHHWSLRHRFRYTEATPFPSVAAPPPSAVTTPLHAPCAASTGWLAVPSASTQSALSLSHASRAAVLCHTVAQHYSFFILFSEIFFDLNSRKFVKLKKLLVNTINLRKCKPFFYNPIEQIYAVGLTNSLFVHYSLVDISYKSNLKAFNYKNLYKI